MAALRHPNIVLFMGMVIDPPCLVSEWCARGSLYDVLAKARKSPALAPALDWTRRLNMALDAAKAGAPCDPCPSAQGPLAGVSARAHHTPGLALPAPHADRPWSVRHVIRRVYRKARV